jgi:hypothetical protein
VDKLFPDGIFNGAGVRRQPNPFFHDDPSGAAGCGARFLLQKIAEFQRKRPLARGRGGLERFPPRAFPAEADAGSALQERASEDRSLKAFRFDEADH